MKKGSKKRIIASAALSIALCGSLVTGATYALFTSESAVNIAVTSGKVNVEAKIENLSATHPTVIASNGEGSAYAEGLYGGYASINENTLTLENMVAGDKVTFDIVITNYSTVSVLYKTTYSTSGNSALLNELEINAGESSDWVSLNAASESGNVVDTLHCSVELPGTAVVQGKSCSISFAVNAVQGNAEVPSVWNGRTLTQPTKNAEDNKYHISLASEFAWLMDRTNQRSTSLYLGETFVLDRDLDFAGATISGIGSPADNIVFTFDGNGHTVSNFVINAKDEAHKEINEEGETEYRYAGLFQQFSGTIRNLIVRNATVIGDQMAGIIASNVDGAGKIDNCKVYDSTIIGAKKVGTVAGYIAGAGCSITNCHAENCNVYAANSSEAQSNEIVGYINNYGGDATVSDNDAINVNVYRGVAELAEGVVKNGNTYEISSAAGLNWFNDQANKHRNSFNNCTIKLMNDIDMGGASWLPVGQNFRNAYGTGYDTVQFLGKFDAQGHTISNLKIEGVNAETIEGFTASEQQVYSVGFFGYITGGTVKDLKIKNVTVKGYHYVGTIVGMTDSASKIENCHVENATIAVTHLTADQCGDKVGGIVGNLQGSSSVANCSVKSTTITAGRDAGQVVGCAQPGYSVTDCTVENVTVSASVGCNGNNIKNEIVGRVV